MDSIESSTITLTRARVREIDRLAIEEFGIPGIVLMENAARNAAAAIREAWPAAHSAAIVCGGGNNGGDGFAIARHLTNAGWTIRLFLAAAPDRLSGDALTNFRIARKMSIPCERLDAPDRLARQQSGLGDFDVVIDALLGTGFSGAVRPPLDAVIAAINLSRPRSKIAAIDVPSGLDCDSGEPSNATVRADLTITFAAAKSGFAGDQATEFLGRVVIADIGVPAALVRRFTAP